MQRGNNLISFTVVEQQDDDELDNLTSILYDLFVVNQADVNGATHGVCSFTASCSPAPACHVHAHSCSSSSCAQDAQLL